MLRTTEKILFSVEDSRTTQARPSTPRVGRQRRSQSTSELRGVVISHSQRVTSACQKIDICLNPKNKW